MSQVIGTCSECGGPVVMPGMMVNPVPVCQRCGAVKDNGHGPVIPMTPRYPRPERDNDHWRRPTTQYWYRTPDFFVDPFPRVVC